MEREPESPPPELIRRVAGPVRHEISKVRGSRFIGSVAPVSGREAAEAFVEGLREEFRDATHNCFAWRLGSGRDCFRYSDDGEPSGTAGRPILAEIDGRRLRDVVVVVTRYFGGTKLGTGGLLRAYGASAAAALDAAGIEERPITRSLTAIFDYGATGPVSGVLSSFGLEPSRSSYGAEVILEIDVPVAWVEQVHRALVDATTGNIRITRGLS